MPKSSNLNKGGLNTGLSTSLSTSLSRYYALYTLAFFSLIAVLAVCERWGMSRTVIAYIFMLFTVLLYAGIGLLSRSIDVSDYYVAGRQVPAVFNGMATAADWMSAASFLSLAGGLYLQGFDGLAFIIGWTGGYCLVAFLLAPYLRQFGQYTIPDFLGARFGGDYRGNPARLIAVFAAIVCSFIYVVAQIYGVGLITSRLSSFSFEIGVFLGLSGILACSFLGGMKAVTWTQVAQYIILIVAYATPVVWLAVKHTGIPIPQIAYGSVLASLSQRETELSADPKELQVRALYQLEADVLGVKIDTLPGSYEQGKQALIRAAESLRVGNLGGDSPGASEMFKADAAVKNYPRSVDEARQRWVAERAAALQKTQALAGMPPHAVPYPAKEEAGQDKARKNFLALVFCLMVGTAALPHILMRYYTTSSVRQARESVFWTLFFILLLYTLIPALAVLLKYDVFTTVVGANYADLPSWVANWSRIDGGGLLKIKDINKDGIVQLAEMYLSPEIIVLAAPEIAGLPYVISGLVAAGGLAAALSTADGLLLTISSALSHDVYYKLINPSATPARRVTMSKVLLLFVAVLAAYITAQRPGDILFLVGAAFSLAASALFPALVLGVFWKRANAVGANLGMLAGMGVCLYYCATRYPFVSKFFGIQSAPLWWDINPIAAGVFGVPVGFTVIVFGSLLSKPPDASSNAWVDFIRHPNTRDKKTGLT